MSHFVQTTNASTMAIYRKSDLALLRTMNLQNFFGSQRGVFDPHMTLDYDSRRFVVVATDGTDIHVGISRTTDPMSGGWCNYRLGGLNADNPGGLADYPLVAFNKALYISVTEFDSNRVFTGNRMIIVNRSDLLNCVGARVGTYSNLTYPGTSQRVGPITPVTGTSTTNGVPGMDRWVASRAGGGQDITLFEYRTDAGLTIYGMPSQAYAAPPDAVQRDSATRIDAGDSRIFQATDVVLKDGLGSGYVAFALSTACTYQGDTTQYGCTEWFKIRTGCGNADCQRTIHKQGIFGFGNNVWSSFPSVALDNQGNMVFNFALSGGNYHPSAATIMIGVLSGFSDTYIQDFGRFTYNVGSPARWGDYTSIFLDPVGQNPGRTFWSVGQTTIANDRWGTHISGIQSIGS